MASSAPVKELEGSQAKLQKSNKKRKKKKKKTKNSTVKTGKGGAATSAERSKEAATKSSVLAPTPSTLPPWALEQLRKDMKQGVAE